MSVNERDHQLILLTNQALDLLQRKCVGIQIKRDHPAYKNPSARLEAFTVAYGLKGHFLKALLDQNLIHEYELPDGSIMVTHKLDGMSPEQITAAFATISTLSRLGVDDDSALSFANGVFTHHDFRS